MDIVKEIRQLKDRVKKLEQIVVEMNTEGDKTRMFIDLEDLGRENLKFAAR